jgi:biopolymer transport protein ExbD
MTEKRRFLDVWLVDPNTVYREVPFTVVVDWVQQSRLLPDDKLRPSGTAEWFRVGDSPDFSPYIPRSEPVQVEDQAGALEPVHMEFAWKRPHDDDDDDVDMIPLIDVSLVLLVFFIMTAVPVVASVAIKTPATYNGLVVDKQEKMLWLDVRVVAPGQHTYSISFDDKGPAVEADRERGSLEAITERLSHYLDSRKIPIKATIRADRNAEAGVVRKLTEILTEKGAKVSSKFIAVSEKGTPE